MYLSFYGLKESPFQISTNPRFLWLGEKHQEALASLRYGILDNKGFLLLTGGVGTGKTTLINALLASLEKNVLAVTIPDPGLEQLDLYYFIATAFKIQADFPSKGRFLVIFSRFLNEMHEQGKKVLLIIDEAQRLSPSMLEEIRLLSNIEKPDTKLINIFFVGQMEFNGILLRQENRALRQRISVNYHIPPLSLVETSAYLEHRLKVAGATRSLFSGEAVQQIYYFSRGFPRLINVIADRALLTGFVNEEREIGAQTVAECAQELKIPEPKRVVRRAKPVRVRPPVQEIAAEESEEQDEGEEEGPKKQAGKPKIKGAAVEPEKPPVVPEDKTPPQPRGAEVARVTAETADQLPGKRGMRKTWLLVAVLVALAVAAFFWFHSVGIRNAVQEVQNKVVPLVQKKAHSPAPEPVSGEAASGKQSEKDGNSKTSDPSVPAAASAKPDGPGSAAGASTREKASGGGAVVKDGGEDNSPARDEGMQSRPGQLEKGGAETGTAKAGSPSATAVPLSPGHPLILGFDTDTNNLSTYGIFMLNRFAKEMQSRPYNQIIIRGYSDARGNDDYNQRLSLFRANIVKSYLTARGVKPDSMVTMGLGAEKPLASNDTVEGRRKNRRVVIEVRP